MRVAIYGRASTRDKDQDPLVQLAPMREYVTACGWAFTEYVDRASAADCSRRDHGIGRGTARPTAQIADVRGRSHCIRLQNDSIIALSKQSPTEPIDGSSPESTAPRVLQRFRSRASSATSHGAGDCGTARVRGSTSTYDGA